MITLGSTKTVKSTDSQLDAFSRLRVSEPFPIFENKNVLSKNTSSWSEVTNGAGASITHVADESSVALAIGTTSGEYAIRQTVRYLAYVPGKSQLIAMTGVLATAKTNLTQRIGYFDNNNGLFFELKDSTLQVVIRSNASGSIVDTPVVQSSWNRDKLDGTGPSGITLDITKAQIFIIDFQWLAVGRVRFGFDINGIIYYCHEELHANISSTVYMATPTLPLRYEIRNTGTVASPSSLQEICCSVASEGGYVLPGLEFSASNGVTSKAVTTRAPIFAIRLKSSFNSKENRKTVKFVNLSTYISTNDAFFEIAHIHDPSSITATWNSANADSAVEYSTDITAVTGSPEHVFGSFYGPTGTANKGSEQGIALEYINQHSFISQNYDSTNSQMFVVYATSFTGTTDVNASMTWIEFD